jgi:ATP-dependent protease Clp ATPase subunit
MLLRSASLVWGRLPKIASSMSMSRFMSGSAAAARVDDESNGREAVSFRLEDLFKSDDKSHLTPQAVVEQLDRFIIGQAEAKVSF